MKLLAFTFAIAFILEDNGTFQGILLEKNSPIDKVEVFKKYVLELVNAAVLPFRNNRQIMDGGCECISGIDMYEKASPFDLILAIMSIAKYYYSDLQVIRQTANLSEIKIKDNLIDNIRVIVVRLHSSVYIRDVTLHSLAEKFLFKNNRRSPSAGAGAGRSANDIESDVNCFRSLLSVYLDEDNFTEKLYDGFDIVRALIKADDDDPENDRRWNELDDIIGDISECELNAVEVDYAKDIYESYYF